MDVAIILAAGQGTRMKSEQPKVLHRVCGKPMLSHVLKNVAEAGIEQRIVVVGHGAHQVTEVIMEPGLLFVTQQEQLGTGHAVMMAEKQIPEAGTVMVLCGDTPLITKETLRQFLSFHREGKYAVSVLTSIVQNPTGYGRIVKDENGALLRIVEQKDASPEETQIHEINSGMYCFKADLLKKYLHQLTTDNAQREYYLTDVLRLAVSDGERAGAFSVQDETEILGVNNRIQLSEAEAAMRRRIAEKLMLEGVTMIDPKTVYIDAEVEIGRDTVIYPGTIITGNTKIGEDCLIGQNCRINDSVIGDRTRVQSSTILDSQVGCDTTVGPYAYLRPGTKLGDRVKIGDFVEVKNSNFGNGSKASHLAYIGDADVGEGVNVGCGVVFVNYDGIYKHRTTVEDHAFIGSNSNLVAPVVVEKYGYVAAGSTITKRVPSGALAVAREKERLIEGWGERKMKKKEKKDE